jgi:subtilisin family serine protease
MTGDGFANFIIENNGTITVNNNAILDYETTPNYTLSVTATNQAGVSNAVIITIEIVNKVETTPVLQAFSGTINENAQNGDVVGTISFDEGDSVLTEFNLYTVNPGSSFSTPASTSNTSFNMSLVTNEPELYTTYKKKNDSLTDTISFLNIINSTDIYERMSNTSYSDPSLGMFKKLIDITDILEDNGTVSVILELQSEFYPEGLLANDDAINKQRDNIFNTLSNIINNHFLNQQEILDSIRIFDSIPYFSVKLNKNNFWDILSIPGIIGIEIVKEFEPLLTESTAVIKATDAWSSGYRGAGQTIAILDSGVLKSHDDFEGRVVSEACYSGSVGATSTCPGSVTSSTAVNSGLNCDNTVTGCDHGTHVASIAAGKDGVANDANIIAMQVFSYTNGGSNIGSYDADFIAGLERVYALKDTYNIASANMSLGGGRYASYCDNSGSWQSATKAIIDNLKSAGIATVIASGNDGYRGEVAYPACISTAVTVGATTDTTIGFSEGTLNVDEVTYYSNHNSIIDLLAPGSHINAAISTGNSDYEAKHGTSMATPHVAGAFAIIKEVNSSISVNDTVTLFQLSGKSVTEPITGVTRSRIDIANAITTLNSGFTPSGDEMFTVSLDGEITLQNNTDLDYETAATYTLYAKAKNDAGESNVVTVTIGVNDINDEIPTIDNATFNLNENINSGTVVGNLVVNPGDSPIQNIVLKNRTGDNISEQFAVTTAGVISVQSGVSIDYESNSSYLLYAVATNSIGDSNEANITININDLTNEVKPILANFTASIDENISSVGYHIGDINITNILDLDSNISNFTLTGSGAANFDINSSGALLLANGFTLDYETTPIYYLTLSATNLAGTSESVNVQITINNIPEQVPTLQPFTGSINEADDINTTIGTILFNMGDSAIISFDLNESNGSAQTLFSIDNNGIIKLNLSDTLDYETKQTYNLLATATNSAGVSAPVTATISVTNSLDAKPVLQAFNGSVNENSSGGTTVGNLIILDSGDSTITHFDINNSNGSLSNEFEISTSGVIKVKAGASLDFETLQEYNLSATAYNSAGASNIVDVNITILDIAEVKPVLESITISIDENITDGTLIADFNATNTMDSNITSFSILGDGAGNFEINTTGHVVIANNANIDFESKESYSLTVYATNQAGTSNNVNLNININDIPDKKPILASFSGNVLENASVSTIVGSINIVNSGDSAISAITLKELNSSESANFSAQTDGRIVVKSGAIIDFETLEEHNLTAIATSASGDSNEVNVTIYVIDVAEQVPELNTTILNVDENATVGTLVGNVPIIEEGDSSITSFSLTGTGSGNFDINTTGHISIKTGASLDFETTQQYNFEAYATNSAGNSGSVNVIININDISEVVPILADTTLSLAEDATGGVDVGMINITTKGDSNFTLCSVGGTDSASFIVDNNGTIKVSTGTTFNYNTKQQYNITIKCQNLAGWSNEVNATINITDIASILPVLQPLTINVKETEPKGTTIGQISIDPGDTAITSINIVTAQNTHENNFEILTDGTINLSNTADLNASATSQYAFYVKAYNSLGESNATLITINVVDVDNLYINSVVYDNNDTTTVDDDLLYLYFNRGIKESTLNADISDDFVIEGSGAIGIGVNKTYTDLPYHLLLIEPSTSALSLELKENNSKIAIAFEEITDSSDTYVESYVYTPIEGVDFIVTTGQSNSYDGNGTLDGSIKDDGYYESGKSRSFSRDTTNEVVSDNVQNLIWDDSTNTTNHTKNWLDAQTYCSTSSNFSDNNSNWRLPTIKELSYIVDRTKSSPSIDTSIFLNTNNSNYWTISESNSNSSYAWKVNFNTGYTFTELKTEHAQIFVRCVREQ